MMGWEEPILFYVFAMLWRFGETMRFSVIQNQETLEIYHNGIPLMKDIRLEIATQREGACSLSPVALTCEGERVVVSYCKEDHEKGPMGNNTASGLIGAVRITRAELTLQEVGDVLQWSISMDTVKEHSRVNYFFASNDAIRFHFRMARDVEENYITDAATKLWFQTPSFSRDLTDLPSQTQDIHLRSGKEHIHLLPLVSDDLRTEFKGDALVASVGCGGVSGVEGPILTIAVGNDPYHVIRENFRAGRESGVIRVPLREERAMPWDVFGGFGWCTWDAFYQDVTAEKIYQKLDELREKGIRPRYLLIDDGWSVTKNSKLWELCEDREKFPEGLAACIKRIKDEYGVLYVGVWQAFDGYWYGVHPDSPVAKELADCLTLCPNGLLIPSPDAEKNFQFWDRWHSYLASCGVDFVKVDNQATYSYYIDEVCKNVQGVRAAHEGLERSVFKHFNGRLINCMGMGIYDLLTRPQSALNRNSNDFLPKLDNGFAIHINTNAYNAPVHSQVMYCDYDMWWSRHESAKAQSVLRAISGGPIYSSDPLDATDPTYILPLYKKDGSLPRLDTQGMPTYDCFYTDCEKAALPLKLFNRSGENLTVAAFGLTAGGANGALRLSDIPGADGAYLACEYFSGRQQYMDANTVIPLELEKLDVQLWNLYPVRDGVAYVGDPTIYMGCASDAFTKTEVEIE